MIDVASIKEIPIGKTKRIRLANGQAVLLCNVAGAIFAVDDQCTHEDASLYLGCLKGEEIHCSLHGGRFNVKTGAPTHEPAEIALKTYKVTIAQERILLEP